MRQMYFDIDGNPISSEEWGKKFEGREYGRVGFYKNLLFTISTVWLGLDHSFEEGKILIFETMVFDCSGSSIFMERYSTLDDAVEGHLRITKKFRFRADIILTNYFRSVLRSLTDLYDRIDLMLSNFVVNLINRKRRNEND